MKNETQKVFSLAAIVVAAILFGMVLSGGLDITRKVDAEARRGSVCVLSGASR